LRAAQNNKRTISPLGKFTGWFFSEELKFAVNNSRCDLPKGEKGLKFEIIKGYTLDQKVIFADYVKDLYNLRLQYPK
jgi:hypothetical protein